ncbi:LysR family transcriptional regulator [Trujillonella endophytica]|uniref:Transcriptional regulator, LysR family n=1 Tax=Trujillonella endophytica TaxID=673521 RepID=A0A1H8QT02_9ACTN|nr:LysR family transcriptional regulator [Trujillella endophytica]SEO57061.1 transcriptional regulator, LysR family [Trujillella endophytica]
MDLRQLRAVVTAAETGSVTKAAQLLYLAQPAVSRQISSLEEELGVQLFDRTSSGMRPTAAGLAFVTRARRVLSELERARAEVAPTREAVTGIATIGILGSVEHLLAGPLVEVIGRKHPGIELHLATAYSGHLQQWLDDGDLDLALLYNLTTTQSVRVLPLLRDKLWAVAPREAGLRADQPVDLATVLSHPFIMPIAGQHGIRLLLDEARLHCDVQPRVVAQANSIALQTLLVEAGHGWTVLPGAGVSHHALEGRLSAAPLRAPEIVRTVGLGLPRAGKTPPAVEVVATELLTLVRAAVRSGRWASAELITNAVPSELPAVRDGAAGTA